MSKQILDNGVSCVMNSFKYTEYLQSDSCKGRYRLSSGFSDQYKEFV